MRSARWGALAGSGSALTLALILATASALQASPLSPGSIETAMPVPADAPRSATRDVGVSGSTTKPSRLNAPAELRGRVGAPATGSPSQRREFAAPLPAATTAPSGEPTKVNLTSPLVAGENAPFAEKLRALLTSKSLERTVTRKVERDAIVTLYQNHRGFLPLWVENGGPSDRAQAAIGFLRTIAADGLDPADYPIPNFAVTSPEMEADAELKFTATLLTYARHALNGRIHFSRVSPNIEYPLPFDANEVLNKLANSKDVAKTLASFDPHQPGFRALKTKLAELRENRDDAPPRIEQGPVLKHSVDKKGKEVLLADPRVPLVRERLGLAAEPNDHYTKALAAAVAKYQKAQGLQASGQLNNATIDALNGPTRERKIAAILATMERWRWMARDLGKTHVMLNIPDYHLRVMHNGAQHWMTRVVVGKPTQATPLLTETMKFITVNPTWNVPQSIIYNELLPIYETTDRQIFERQGLKVERSPNGDIRVFQPPGERNALGQIRFNFPNKFLVYMHDTPEKHYFAHDKRAYSHGCMRVQDPMKYAEVLLSFGAPRGNYTQAGLQRMLGGQEHQIDFQQHIPVHITYQTAFVDDEGKLQVRDDIYGLDAKLLSILKGSERAMADVAIDRPADPNFKPTREHEQRLQSVARGSGPNPFAVFEQLFR